MWREEQNIFCQEVDVVKNKNLEGVTVDSCRQKPDVIWETLRACYFRSTSLFFFSYDNNIVLNVTINLNYT